jgi:hypothetical protein
MKSLIPSVPPNVSSINMELHIFALGPWFREKNPLWTPEYDSRRRRGLSVYKIGAGETSHPGLQANRHAFQVASSV